MAVGRSGIVGGSDVVAVLLDDDKAPPASAESAADFSAAIAPEASASVEAATREAAGAVYVRTPDDGKGDNIVVDRGSIVFWRGSQSGRKQRESWAWIAAEYQIDAPFDDDSDIGAGR